MSPLLGLDSGSFKETGKASSCLSWDLTHQNIKEDKSEIYSGFPTDIDVLLKK